MTDRLQRKIRRSRHWRQRAARVRYNELHQEYGRRLRFSWSTRHRAPDLSVEWPHYPPIRDDGWWQQAIERTSTAGLPLDRNKQSMRNAPRVYFTGVGR